MSFQSKLDSIISKNHSLLCINLDPDVEKISNKSLFEFNKTIIDQTIDFVCSYKPNSAFYEALGSEGIGQLKMTVDYIRQKNPELPIILDAKRGDIGSSNKGYISFVFDYLQVDGLTLNPYMGYEALAPFFEKKDKGFFILCKTSNKGSDELQNLMIGERPLYLQLAEKIAMGWNSSGNIMLVVGATYPDELCRIREIVKEMIFLVPGIGVQGGDLQAVLDCGLTASKKGLIIAVGRSILYSDNPRGEAEKFKEEINKYR